MENLIILYYFIILYIVIFFKRKIGHSAYYSVNLMEINYKLLSYIIFNDILINLELKKIVVEM